MISYVCTGIFLYRGTALRHFVGLCLLLAGIFRGYFSFSVRIIKHRFSGIYASGEAVFYFICYMNFSDFGEFEESISAVNSNWWRRELLGIFRRKETSWGGGEGRKQGRRKRKKTAHSRLSDLERMKGIEPSYQAWEARILPLNYTRI